MTSRFASYILNIIWLSVLILAAPLILYRACAKGRYPTGWGQKLLGKLPRQPVSGPDGRFWFHAVSVGEVLQLQPVLRELRDRHPDCDIVITATTVTGHSVAVDKYKDCLVCYWPLDFSWAVRRALRNIQPTQVVLVELEVWPNFLLAAHGSGIPVSIINGRLSEKSFRGYERLKMILKPLLQTLQFVAAQNQEYAGRFCDLGIPADRIHITGSVKFDHVQSDRENAQTQSLRKALDLKSDEPVFIAGSTQPPEEELAIAAWQQARMLQPDLRLILVPRHKERFEEVAALVLSKQLPLFRRSTGRYAAASTSDKPPVLLLDTLGELSACWGLATYAFVGGSLSRRGGQNMIEPAAYGAAVCFGPDTRNFRDIVEALLTHDAARVVTDGPALSALLQEWIQNPQQARRNGERARQFVLTQHGAARKTVSLLCSTKSPIEWLRAA